MKYEFEWALLWDIMKGKPQHKHTKELRGEGQLQYSERNCLISWLQAKNSYHERSICSLQILILEEIGIPLFNAHKHCTYSFTYQSKCDLRVCFLSSLKCKYMTAYRQTWQSDSTQLSQRCWKNDALLYIEQRVSDFHIVHFNPVHFSQKEMIYYICHWTFIYFMSFTVLITKGHIEC